MNELQEYLEINGSCHANGTHKLVITRWPYVVCEHCNQEFMLFTRDMVEHFFEIQFFENRLNS
jgi:hypothetical protein